MIEYLSDKEIKILNYYKEEYDKKESNPIPTMQPKMEIKIVEDIPALLQSKGYLEIERKDLGNNMELVYIHLKNKFFKYFNID